MTARLWSWYRDYQHDPVQNLTRKMAWQVPLVYETRFPFAVQGRLADSHLRRKRRCFDAVGYECGL
jgi:hypothetical protein